MNDGTYWFMDCQIRILGFNPILNNIIGDHLEIISVVKYLDRRIYCDREKRNYFKG